LPSFYLSYLYYKYKSNLKQEKEEIYIEIVSQLGFKPERLPLRQSLLARSPSVGDLLLKKKPFPFGASGRSFLSPRPSELPFLKGLTPLLFRFAQSLSEGL
jgi:hypothetical protein